MLGLRLDQLRRGPAGRHAGIEQRGRGGAGAVAGVQAGVAHGIVEPAVAVEVRHGERAPPAGAARRKAERRRRLLELPALPVEKNGHGPPLAGHDQVGPAVRVDVGPHRRRHQPDVFQSRGHRGGDINVVVAAPGEQRAARHLAVRARHRTPAEEEARPAAVLEIRRDRGADTNGQRRQQAGGDREAAPAVVKQQPRLIGRAAGRRGGPRLRHEQIKVPVGIRVERHDGTIRHRGLRKQVRAVGQVLAAAEVGQQLAGRAGHTPDHQVLLAVAIKVDRHGRWAGTVQPERQQGLLRPLVIGPLRNRQVQRQQRAVGRELAGGRAQGRRRRTGRFRHHIAAVGGEVFEDLARAARPFDREFLDRGFRTEPEVHDRLAGGEVTPREGERAHLAAPVGFDPHHGTDPETVGRGAAQLENDRMAAGPIVAAHGDRCVHAGVDQVEVPVAVEVGEGRPEPHAHLVESPRVADVLEVQVAQVPEGQMPFGQHRRGFGDADALGEALASEHALGDVEVVELAHHAVGEKDVEPAVVVEVLQAHGPGPVGGGQPGELGGLKHPAGPGAEEEGVAHVLGRRARVLLVLPEAGPELGHAPVVLFAGGRRHVGDQQVQVPVIVQVAEVGAH